MRKPTINQGSFPITWDSLSEEELDRVYEQRAIAYNQLIKLQFQLSYHAHISIRDLDAMTRYEYMQFYNELMEQKNAEKDAMEKSIPKKG